MEQDYYYVNFSYVYIDPLLLCFSTGLGLTRKQIHMFEKPKHSMFDDSITDQVIRTAAKKLSMYCITEHCSNVIFLTLNRFWLAGFVSSQ